MGQDFFTKRRQLSAGHGREYIQKKPGLWLAKDARYSRQWLGEGSTRKEAENNLNDMINQLGLTPSELEGWNDKRPFIQRS